MKRKLTAFDWILILFFLITSVTFIYPFWQIAVKSIITEEQYAKDKLLLWPWKLSFDAYRITFKSGSVLLAYKNTIKRTVIGTFLSVFVTFAGSYALSKPRLPFQRPIMKLITFTMFFNGGLIPSYLLNSALGLKNSFWVLIFPGLVSAWNIILARNYLYMLPSEIEESAYVDGAGVFMTLFKIIVPLSMPIIAVLILYNAVSHWNAWFDAYIYMKGEENVVLQLLLRRILYEVQLADSEMLDDINTRNIPPSDIVTAATIILTIGPILAIYPFLQKYFVKGIMLGAIKG